MVHRTNALTDWKSTRLIEVCNVNPPYKLTTGDVCSFIDMAAVNEDSPNVKRIETKQYNKQSGSKFTNGDVLFARITPCTENGKTALVEGLHTKYGIGSTEFIVLSPLKERLDSKYLYYLVKWPVIRNKAIGRMIGTTGRQRVPNDFFRDELMVDLPSLNEQQKIADILTSVDSAISKTEAIIEQTEKVKKGLMQQLLTKGIGHTKFKQTEIGEIPEEWEVKRIDDIAKVIRGASPRPKGDPRYYGGNVPRLMVADVTRDYKYVTPTTDFLTEEGAKLSRPMPAGSLVVVCSGTVGVPAILSVDACIHDGFLALKDIESNCESEYLFYIFTLLKNKFDASATHGGVFTNLTTQIMKDFLIPIPSASEQRGIIDVLCQIDLKLEAESKKHKQLITVKNGLMQELLTGKVRVKVDDQEAVTT
jgi:Restriction endonuclease S subunits